MRLFRDKIRFPEVTLQGIFFLTFLSFGVNVHVQNDTAYKNTVRFNVTNPLILGHVRYS
jgi:hypothetical protein